MTMRLATSLVVAAAMLAASPSFAQSLADVARKEAERRGTAPKPGKVYTNGSLTPDFTTPPAPSAPAPAVAQEGEAKPEDSADAATSSPESEIVGEVPPKKERGEDYWRARADRIRVKIEQQKATLEALRQRIDSMAELEDSTAARERELTQAKLSQARSTLIHLEQEWTNFEATARAKNVPDAWIR